MELPGLLAGLGRSSAPAVVEGRRTTTYADLLERAEATAATLRACGAGPGCVVPLQAAPSTDAVVTVVGILMTGAAFAPVDLRVPPTTVVRIARLCGSSFCLTTGGPTFEGVSSVPLEDLAWLDAERPRLAPTVPADTTYVVFTSGTSGTPKGVVVPQEAVDAYLNWSMREYDLDRGYGAPLMTSLGFDLTMTSLLGPLVGGRRIEVLDRLRWPVQVATAPEVFETASFVKLTPSQVSLLCDVLEQQDQVCAIPRLVVGGEALYGQAVARWRRVLPGVVVVNEYGPSEATVGCCRAVVPEDFEGHEVPIGTAAPGITLGVRPLGLRDGHDGVGVEDGRGSEDGELLIAGAQVAHGYLRAEDGSRTREPGILSPFPAGPSGRKYASGDRVRRLTGGTFVYLGRLGREVKVAGFRVNLAALESRLSAYPGVVSAAVQPGAEDELRAVVAVQRAGITTRALFDHLREVFPSYALPTEIELVRDVRTTERGKSTMQEVS